MTASAAPSNRNSRIISGAIRCFAAALALAGAAPAETPPARVTEAALMRHVAALADDAMAGRRPGTPGEARAVRYIAAEMRAAGLRPGAADGGWYQPVDLVERRPLGARTRWRVNGGKVSVAADELALIGRAARQRLTGAPLVFGGYGLKADLEGIDLAGAIVLLLPGKPPKAPDAPPLAARRAVLAEAGASAVVMLMAADASWPTIRQQYAAGRTQLAGDEGAPIAGAIAYPAWARLLAAAGHDPNALQRAAGEEGFRAVRMGGVADLQVRTALRRYRSVNVIGRLEGAARAEEAVLFTAHWDHLGICRAATVKDRICNGAVDNASGIAVMIEAARGLAGGRRPGRSILFVGTTAEELGLLGARAFVRSPPLSLGSIVAALNLDTMAIVPRGAPIAVIGRGMTRLDPLIDATARSLGRKVDTGTEANAYVMRQDGWELMQAGIPAVMVGGAFSEAGPIGRYFASRYHGPTDEVGHGLELGGAAEDTEFHIALARTLADPARFTPLGR